MAWVEAICHGRKFVEELDAKRFRTAFTTMAATRKSWPTPIEFVEALPPREQLALTKQPIPADPERAAAAIAEVERLLRM